MAIHQALFPETVDRIAPKAAGDEPSGSVAGPRPDDRLRFHYLPFLDGLRAVSILAVLAFHEMGPISARVGALVNGWVGVDVFFVISGFLITSLLAQERSDCGSFSFRGFYVRRSLRIWPAYYLFIGSMLLWEGWKVSRQAAISGLFLSDIWISYFRESLGIFDHTWSLAVEEQFYLAWPVILFLSGRRAIPVSLLLIGSVWAWRLSLLVVGSPWIRLTGGFDTKFDCLLIGCLAALFRAEPAARRAIRDGLSGHWVPWLVVAALIGSAQAMGHPSDRGLLDRFLLWSFKLPLFTVLVAVLILALIDHPASPVVRLLSTAPMTWLGKLSYSLYLWHPIVFRDLGGLMRRALPAPIGSNPYCVEAAKFGISLLLAAASFYLAEIPFLRLKKRWVRVPARSTVPPGRGLVPEDVPGRA